VAGSAATLHLAGNNVRVAVGAWSGWIRASIKLDLLMLPLIAAARIERDGRTWIAPQDYWKQAIEEMLNKRDKLTLPLKNHGYLLTIIESYSNKAEARKEQQHENQLAGRTPVGGTTHTVRTEPVEVQKKPRTQMPQTVKAILKGGNDEQP